MNAMSKANMWASIVLTSTVPQPGACELAITRLLEAMSIPIAHGDPR